MKTRFRITLRGALALTVLVAACSLAGRSQAAQKNSPAGTWDCTFTGPHGQKGLAFLTFIEVGTNRVFNGFQLLVASPSSSGSDNSNAQRNPGGQETRSGFVTETGSSSSSFTTLIGFGEVSGPWDYDSDNNARIVGYFPQLVNVGGIVTNYATVCVSNTFTYQTNFPGSTNGTTFQTNLSFCFNSATFSTNVTWTDPTNASTTFTFNNTNFTVTAGSAETTNQVSFVGKAVPGTRLTLNASSTFGKLTYRGTKYNPNLKDLTGRWQAARKQEGQTFLELFTLTSFATGNPFSLLGVSDTVTNFPNIYWSTNGSGASYSFIAVSALSVHKQIGFVLNATDADLRSTLGAFIASKNATKANTKGLQLPDTSLRYNAVFQGP